MQKLREEHAALQYELVGLRRRLLQAEADAAPVRPVQFAAVDADPDTLRFYADRLAQKFAFVKWKYSVFLRVWFVKFCFVVFFLLLHLIELCQMDNL